ncbi:sortase [Candidatus Woesebacteria bacterium]|nr:sortase [Candidatus Woesebacteria bacterium]
MEKGDEVDIFYKGKLLKYLVNDKKVVSSGSVSYLGNIKSGSTLTLQTCYPPGTTLQRLVVTADLVK